MLFGKIQFDDVIILRNAGCFMKKIDKNGILARWKLTWSLAKNDFRSRYVGSQLGLFWAFFRPMVMAGVYIFVFSVIARAAPVSDIPYAFWLLPGLIVWFVFNEGVSSGTTALADYSYLVKQVKFDVTILPTVKVMAAFIIHTFFIILIFVLYLIWGLPIRIQLLQLSYYYFALFCLTTGVARITCACQPFFKDISSAVEVILLVFMWACPVMWDVTMLPEEYHVYFRINPLYHILNGYRESFMGGPWFWEHYLQMTGFWVFTALLHYLGRRQYKKLSVHFADVL